MQKTVTSMIRRARSGERQLEIATQWTDKWHDEQSRLIDRLDVAAELRDFDNASIAIGQLRAITDKKFTALYNILAAVGAADQAASGARPYEWGRWQTGVVAIAGRKLAAQDWPELQTLSKKLQESVAMFAKIKSLLTSVINGDSITD